MKATCGSTAWKNWSNLLQQALASLHKQFDYDRCVSVNVFRKERNFSGWLVGLYLSMRRILPLIVISQFFCTSVWFAGNSIISDISKELQTGPDFLAHLTSAIQFGFIAGTLIFAVFTIADRFSPSRVFFVSAVMAALLNLGISIDGINATQLLLLRFLTGFFLAGIYPVGMKIASDYYQQGLGKSLGFLVGALVIGTSFPHLLKTFTKDFAWQYVVYGTSILSIAGGLGILLFVPDGPHRKKAPGINLIAFLKGFRNPSFRSMAFGYFGHMWELYTFWAFIPVIITVYNKTYGAGLNVSFLSFLIIAAGGPACALSGVLSQHFGAKRVAAIALSISGACCIFSPLLIYTGSVLLFISFLIVWGLTVPADSPLFSSVIAKHAPVESRGASLTIVNCIGFSITIVSIQTISWLSAYIDQRYIYLLLAPGPILGLWAMMAVKNKE